MYAENTGFPESNMDDVPTESLKPTKAKPWFTNRSTEIENVVDPTPATVRLTGERVYAWNEPDDGARLVSPVALIVTSEFVNELTPSVPEPTPLTV